MTAQEQIVECEYRGPWVISSRDIYLWGRPAGTQRI
jgi:hypothetical protein